MVAAMSFAAASAVCWSGVRALGRQWRIDAAAIAFAAGTAIRVRIEDGLLRRRFGPAFDDYRAQVPAFVPRLRFRSL